MRTTIRVAGAMLALTTMSLLSACGVLPSPGDLLNPPPIETVDPEGELKVGDCLDDVMGAVADSSQLVTCATRHHADLVGLVEWSNMDALIAESDEEGAWKKLSNARVTYTEVLDFDHWGERACGQSFREVIGWTDIEAGGKSAEELDLLPGGAYELRAALAPREAFVVGDHRIRCLVRWYDPIAYTSGQQLSDLLDPAFPNRARDCYQVDDDYNLFAVECSQPHTDQSMLMFSALALGEDFIRDPDTYDAETLSGSDSLCDAMIRTVYGDWNEDLYYAWSGWFVGGDWDTAESGAVDEGLYPFGCFLSTWDGTTARSDLMSMS
ncbi:septum formation family protein [Homoserinibacter sp. GY 40078]|uniref:septum formation family protein n=1 Tax=Homoserinibacter sp. GY 40078 TaxID=2603275 RepID=UPI0011CBF62F|nr:septum formation family protein [Homoserinibacter sp. GY 40078]TXK17178.1 hypothetical protein FVQ89_09965 [Homoserinibacter sp. GY 40078]